MNQLLNKTLRFDSLRFDSYSPFVLLYYMPTEILPSLWVGDIKDSLNESLIKNKHINIIINCTEDLEFIKLDGVTTKRLAVSDSKNTVRENADAIMLNALPSLTQYIHQQLASNNAILVHCYAGRQRSIAVILGYLIRYGKFSVEEAVEYVRSKHPEAAQPSCNFIKALVHFRNIYGK